MSDRMDIRGAIGDGAARMSLPDLPQPEETQALLTGALRELEGIDTRLETWTADDHFTQFGKRLVVRYDLEARLAAAPNVRRYHWLGKFYDRDEDARRVASVLRELASFDGHAQSGLAFPSVLAYHAPLRLLALAPHRPDPDSVSGRRPRRPSAQGSRSLRQVPQRSRVSRERLCGP